MGFIRPRSYTLDQEDMRIPEHWKRDIRQREADGKTIVRQAKSERCVLCANFDFVFPISIYACGRCRERAIGYNSEAKVLVCGAITHRPCFYCGKREGSMKKINTRSCHKCISRIARLQRNAV